MQRQLFSAQDKSSLIYLWRYQQTRTLQNIEDCTQSWASTSKLLTGLFMDFDKHCLRRCLSKFTNKPFVTIVGKIKHKKMLKSLKLFGQKNVTTQRRRVSFSNCALFVTVAHLFWLICCEVRSKGGWNQIPNLKLLRGGTTHRLT